MTRRTLVVHTGGIGDFIVACPALAEWAKQGPLELAGRQDRLQLAVAAGLAEAAHELDTIAFESIFTRPKQTLIAFIQRFDRVLVWMRDEDGHIVHMLRELGVRDARAFPGLPPGAWSRHAADYYAECIGVSIDDSWALRIPPAPATSLDLVVHPGSGSRRKNWPREHFEALSRHADDQGWRIHWTLGPAEEGYVDGFGSRNMLAHQSLVELAAHLAAARVFVGNDSGISHLAAAVGCPTVAVFGPTDPRVWAPRGSKVAVLQGTPWPGVRDVVNAVARLREDR